MIDTKNMRAHLMRYAPKTFDLLPLHRPKDVMKLKGGKTKEVGKAPIDRDWTKRPYDSKAVRERCIKEKRNTGVRLKAEQLVIDVDPRNGGEAGFSNLCHDLGIDGDAFPRVITGSGGWHCYMTKPADMLIRDTLDAEEYDGVEFKSVGRQVVAAGSIHPNGNPYLWSPDHPDIADGMPKVPKTLLNAIKRPPRAAISGGGQYSQEQIATALSKLDVTTFNSNDKWFQLMQACHHASGGDARSEFLDWSTGDSHYAGEAYLIGKRWDSLHADRNDGVTYRTLNKILRDNGASSSQAAPVVDDDEFDDGVAEEDDPDIDTRADPDELDFDSPDDEGDEDEAVIEHTTDLRKLSSAFAEFDKPMKGAILEDGVRAEDAGGWPEESVNALEKLNREYVCLLEAGKFRIMYKMEDAEMDNREKWEVIDRPSFESMYMNRSIMRDMTNLSKNAQATMPLGAAWISWPMRRTIKGLKFEPDSAVGEKDGFMNLWTGFATQPDFTRKGSWKWMQELIHEVLADGDQRVSDYLRNWIAFMLQYPAVVPEAAIVFQGGEGIGKGTLGNNLVRLIGQHAHAIGTPEQLTGRFNAHMRNLIFLFADEASNAYNKAAEGTLRHLISEPFISIEKKGVDLVRVRNLLHIMMATNERWAIPAGKDARRFMVQHASDKWAGTGKFNKLYAELWDNDGLGARCMMADLLSHEFPSTKLNPVWHPRLIPLTQALIQQKMMSMGPISKFFMNIFSDRQLPFPSYGGEWSASPVYFFLEDFKDAFNVFCRASDIKPGSGGRNTHTTLMNEIKDTLTVAVIGKRLPLPKDSDGDVPTTNASPYDGLALAIEIPDMAACARAFEESNKFPRGQLGIHSETDFG